MKAVRLTRAERHPWRTVLEGVALLLMTGLIVGSVLGVLAVSVLELVLSQSTTGR